MSATFRVFAPDSTHHIDLDVLPITDRAVLRLLNRAGAATAVQLSQLVYGSLRVSQKHLLRLYQSGLLERLPLADERHGQAEYAYRLGALGHEQLQTGSPLSPGTYLRHTLDIVSTVCALNGSDDREQPPVQLWYAASMTTNILTRFLRPDSIVLVTTDAGSVVLALEIDEGLHGDARGPNQARRLPTAARLPAELASPRRGASPASRRVDASPDPRDQAWRAGIRRHAPEAGRERSPDRPGPSAGTAAASDSAVAAAASSAAPAGACGLSRLVGTPGWGWRRNGEGRVGAVGADRKSAMCACRWSRNEASAIDRLGTVAYMPPVPVLPPHSRHTG